MFGLGLGRMGLPAGVYGRADAVTPTMLTTEYLGANLRGTASYGGAMMYVDIVRNARSFAKPATPYANLGLDPQASFAAVKADGWPSESFSICLLDAVLSHPYQAGTYEGSFIGTAASVSGSSCVVQNVRVEGSKTRFQVVIDGLSSAPVITVTSPSGDFADLRVIRPGYAWDSTQLLTTEYLATIASYPRLRMMDHQNTSTVGGTYPGFDSKAQTSWANRWTPTSTYAGQIMRQFTLEEQVLVANTTGKDLWLCIPHAADDSYITGMLQLVHSTLAPTLKCYVEYSNEIWSTSLAYAPQNVYCRTQARLELGLFGGADLATQISSIVISGGGTLATITFLVPHGVTNGQTIKVVAGSSGSRVVAGQFVATVVSPTVLTIPLTGATDGTITMTTMNTFVVTNAASNLAYDFVAGKSGSEWWMPVQNEYYWGYRYAFKRLGQANLLAAAALPAGYLDRIKFVAALQFANIGTFSPTITYLNQNYGPIKNWLHAISAAVYVSASGSATTVDDIITSLQTDNETKRLLYYRWVATARYYGVKFMQYEIGTDMVVATAASSAVRKSANTDSRMQGITKTMLTNALTMGCDGAEWYIEGVAKENGGGNFDIRQTPFDTAATNPRLAGLQEAQATIMPTDFPQYWGNIPSVLPTSSSSTPYTQSGFATIAHNGINTACSVQTPGNLVFATNGLPSAIKGEFNIAVFCPADGNYSLTPQLAANGAGVTFRCEIDGVDQGVSIAAANLNPYSVAIGDLAPFTVAITKGWHLIRFVTTNNISTPLGCRQLKIVAA